MRLSLLLLCAARCAQGVLTQAGPFDPSRGPIRARPLGTPFSMAFRDLSIACRSDKQPAASAMAEHWTIEREPSGELVGRVVFQVNEEAKVARVTTFEMPGDDDDADDESSNITEDLSRFVLAALGARISQFDIEVVMPMEVTPMIELAAECLRCDDEEEPAACCDSEGHPIMLSVPRAFALQHQIWRLEGDGRIVMRTPASGTGSE